MEQLPLWRKRMAFLQTTQRSSISKVRRGTSLLGGVEKEVLHRRILIILREMKITALTVPTLNLSSSSTGKDATFAKCATRRSKLQIF